MSLTPKLDMDEVLPEFGVTRREVDAEIKRRLAAPGRSYTTAEVREHFRRLSADSEA
jgi:hypothetical protein